MSLHTLKTHFLIYSITPSYLVICMYQKSYAESDELRSSLRVVFSFTRDVDWSLLQVSLDTSLRRFSFIKNNPVLIWKAVRREELWNHFPEIPWGWMSFEMSDWIDTLFIHMSYGTSCRVVSILLWIFIFLYSVLKFFPSWGHRQSWNVWIFSFSVKKFLLQASVVSWFLSWNVTDNSLLRIFVVS